jgi:cell division protease FtsH
MVARFGMAEEVAPLRLLGPDAAAFLGDETPLADIAPETKAALDQAIRRLMTEAQTSAAVLLEHHRAVLDDFAATLTEHETLEGAMLQAHLDALQKKMKPVGKGGIRAKGVSANGSRSRRQPTTPAQTTSTN